MAKDSLYEVGVGSVFVRLRGAQIPVAGVVIRQFAAVVLANLFNIEVAGKCHIGPGLILPHPNDIIIGGIEIGANAILMNSVTLGAKYPDPAFSPNLRPRLGCAVIVGAGARVLGGITLGDRVVVGANSVVIKNVPSGAVVAGVPARLIGQAGDV